MNTAAIDVTDTTVHYGNVLALDRVNLHIQPGTICGLLGTNGSGKSTLFKTILGLTRPDHGRTRIMGRTRTAARRPPHRTTRLRPPVRTSRLVLSRTR